MTYDQWKCTDPREYEPEECDCADYDEDWEGRCTCGKCGRIWYKTAADMKADVEREKAYERYIKRTEWKDWLLFPWRRFRAWAFPRVGLPAQGFRPRRRHSVLSDGDA